MPYISDNNNIRHDLYVGNVTPSNAGELNYLFTMIIKDYIKDRGQSYQTLNDIVGAMENCKLELYRRLISVYENVKISTNGDVYDK
jgi:hypothetical protein